MKIGEVNELTVLRFASSGAYLGDDEDNDVLLPGKYIPDELQIGDTIEVFLYKDSEDRLVATTERPLIELYGFAYLTVKEVTLYGAFLDWGLEKDLMVPFREQSIRMEEGEKYLICLMLDPATSRLYGSNKTKKLFWKYEGEVDPSNPVELLICESSELGRSVVVDNRYSGLIYTSDLTKPVSRGETTTGYIYNVRPDGKLDIRLEPEGRQRIDGASGKLLEILQRHKRLALHDKSAPEEIQEAVGMSKKTFKQAIGQLYKSRLIEIHEDGISLVETSKS